MVTYLTNKALQDRCRQHNLATTGNRECLLDRCHTHGLVTDYEHLCQRNIKESRIAWLTFELAKLGCVLRADSSLCEDYINNDVGSPIKIAQVMAEMKFYHEHTQYTTERDILYKRAREMFNHDMDRFTIKRDKALFWDRDFDYFDRPQFNEYFDKDEASDSAKNTAFNNWLLSHESEEAALECAELPNTMKNHLMSVIAKKRYKHWVNVNFGSDTKLIMYASTLRKKLLNDCDLSEHTDAIFHNLFHAKLCEFVRCRELQIKADKDVITLLDE
jgi:hypothetical protein